MFQFIKTTALGGILFLIPVVILFAIFKKAHELVGGMAGPVYHSLPVERVAGFAILDFITIAILLLICFLAGLAAKSHSAVRWVNFLESGFLSKLPIYDVTKTKLTAGLRLEEAGGDSHSVLVRLDDQWLLGIEVERIAGGKVAVYLPGSPDPWSGCVVYMTEDRVEPLEIEFSDAVATCEQLGRDFSGV